MHKKGVRIVLIIAILLVCIAIFFSARQYSRKVYMINRSFYAFRLLK